MSRIFVTSDTHFGHDRGFLFSPRGFTSIQEHDAAVIANWNSVVNPDDVVYHLGDVMLNDNEHGLECLRQLNGHIKIVPGNHDTDKRIELYKQLENIEVLPMAITLKYKKYNFYLSHHPTLTSNLEKAPYLRMHLINLYGHTHQQDKFFQDMPYMFHVGMDSNGNKPVSLDDAIEMMKEGVYLVNTSRGSLIDTDALIDGLVQGKFGGVGLDVYEEEEGIFYEDKSNEIMQDENLARLMTFPNVLITSHMGFFTKEAMQAIAKETLENAYALENGLPLVNRTEIR